MNLSRSQNESALLLTVPAPQLSRLDKIYAKPMRKFNYRNSPDTFWPRHGTSLYEMLQSNILVKIGLETPLSAWILAQRLSAILYTDDSLRDTACSDSRINQISEPTVPLVLSWITVGASLNQQGKTNLSHDGLNPAHVPYQRVNNPTLGEFCFTMIGRADIEGSKSNVAMNAWLPQASYPCGNFSDTSNFISRNKFKGSIGHAFTV